MANETERRVVHLLEQVSERGLSAVRELFWTELNYDRANEPLSARTWPRTIRQAIAGPPLLLARHAGDLGVFDVIYVKLSSVNHGRGLPLSRTPERAVISQLLLDYPYALFIFSDAEQRHWHPANVRARRDPGDAEAAARSTRPVIRRIAIGPVERLRIAAERVAMLDLGFLSPTPTGLSPIVIQQRLDEAFDVEAVTQAFFTTYRQVLEHAEAVRLCTLRALQPAAPHHLPGAQGLADRRRAHRLLALSGSPILPSVSATVRSTSAGTG